MLNYRSGATVTVLAAVILLVSCQTIPTQEFDAYLAHFQTAKTATEDVILKARIRAKTIADDPRNRDITSVRAKQLKNRQAALQARLEALSVIDSYNRVLTGLASGRPPEDIASDMVSFSDGLSEFNVDGISDLVDAGSPYLGLISEAISLIDGYILAKQFGKVAAAGEKPVLGIVQVLVDDADNLVSIESQWIKLNYTDPHRKQINDIRKQIQRLALTIEANKGVDRVIVVTNAHLQRYRIDAAKKPPVIDNDVDPSQKPVAARASDIEVLKLLAARLGESVDEFNAGLDRIDAYEAMIVEYQGVLGSTSKSLVSLNRMIATGRPAAGVDLVTSVYRLRESYLALEEAQ